MWSNLKYLYVKNDYYRRKTDSGFIKIPHSLRRLKHLETLMLERYDEESLPDFLWKMPSLKEVKIKSSLLKDVPQSAKITSDIKLDKILSNDKIIDLLNSWKNDKKWNSWKNDKKWNDKHLFEFLNITGHGYLTIYLNK